MHTVITCIFFIISICTSHAQGVTSRLSDAIQKLEQDPSFKHASLSLYVVDTKTGKPVYDKNSQMGLAPASCQKVITAVAAYELLGKDYRYKTGLEYEGKITGGVLNGNVILSGSGDPTLGSWRWKTTSESMVLNEWITAIKQAGITSVNGSMTPDNKNWGTETIPDGWIWQDIGNYYGAGASAYNWRENQYDLILKSGRKIGDTCEMIKTDPILYKASLICEVTTAAKGTGDNAFIYLPPHAAYGYVRGTIPVGENAFSISGSFPNSAVQLTATLKDGLRRSQIPVSEVEGRNSYPPFSGKILLHTHVSPPLDSINYWFLKKSINLYGEALVKTIGLEKQGLASTTKGLEIIKYFWSQRGIEKAAINIIDGSGLSPQNRVTTDALVTVMQYAGSRPWFNSFHHALPEINSIKMKSGSIGGARSYTGYIKSGNGSEYTFAFIINNYDGSATETVRKMWRVLDVMK